MMDMKFSTDFKDCMKQAKAVMDKTKKAHDHYFGYFLFKFLGSYVFPSAWFDNKVGDILKDMPALTCSNINGPVAPLAIGDGLT